MFGMYSASLGAQAKTEISNTSAVSATLGIGGERFAFRRWNISARLPPVVRCYDGSAPPRTACLQPAGPDG